MCVKFGDDSISSLDFSFIGGGVPLNTITIHKTNQNKKIVLLPFIDKNLPSKAKNLFHSLKVKV